MKLFIENGFEMYSYYVSPFHLPFNLKKTYSLVLNKES
jgi:hypothetical protein